MGGATIIIWILVFFGIFYFLAIRPQRRQKQQHAEMVGMLKKGDEVVTIGGMFGTITGIGDDWVELEVAKRTKVRYLKRAISSITSIDEYDEDDDDEYVESEDYEEEYEDAEVVEDQAAADQDQIEDAEQEEIVDEATDETPNAPDAPEAPKA